MEGVGLMKLSAHFDLSEFTHSQTADRLGIDNTPPTNLLPKLMTLAHGMEEVRELLGHPITISSGYRSPAVNQAVGSKGTSQHTLGEACDFVCPAYGSPAKIVRAIVDSTIGFDQVIQEFHNPAKPGSGWVHISFGDRNRRTALIIDASGARSFA